LDRQKRSYALLISILVSFALLLGGCRGQAVEEVLAPPEETVAPATTMLEEETIPARIEEAITEADIFFENGEYSEAQSKYRSAETAIKNEGSISSLKKEELLSYVVSQKEKAQGITQTARIHYGNAMMLQYEKRFEEALAELESAIDVYPKYQDAIDALDSIQSLMGLS
jgi:tetratricopeptide (TPR) repeat protein